MGGKVIVLRRIRGVVEEMSDEAIVAACASGDTAALGVLFDRFHRDVLRFLSRLLGHDCLELDDLAQATFLEVWRSAARFGRRSSVKSWILAISHNLARHHVRGEVRRRTALSLLEKRPPSPERSQEETIGDQMLVERLGRALMTLDPDRRTAFVMCDLEEISGVDAATALGIRPGTLWRRLHEARKALRRALEEGSSRRPLGCPSDEALSRAFPAPESDVARHVETCESCRSTWQSFEMLSRLGKQLPIRPDEPDTLDLLRSRILTVAAERKVPPAQRRRFLPLATAAVVLLSLAITDRIAGDPDRPRVVRAEPPQEPVAVVRGSEHAVFAHRIERGRGAIREEIVELSDGRISLEVEPLEAGQRFLVVTDDSEIELSGTSFALTAVHGKLASVEVLAGRAEVRSKDGAPVILREGERWPPAPASKPAIQERAVPARKQLGADIERPAPLQPEPIARVEIEPAPAEAPDPVESAFVEGLRRFKARDYPGAAESFGVASRDPSAPAAEDAEYWRAIALAKAGRSEAAAEAMRAFLERRSDSARAGEMSLMLGRQLLDLGRIDEARPVFERGLRDRSPQIRERARRALKTIDAAR